MRYIAYAPAAYVLHCIGGTLAMYSILAIQRICLRYAAYSLCGAVRYAAYEAMQRMRYAEYALCRVSSDT